MYLMCRYISSVIRDSAGRLLMEYLPDGYWQALGGEVDEGESPKEAFIRIAGETAGLMLDDIEPSEVIKRIDGREIHVFSATLNESDEELIRKDKSFGLFGEDKIRDMKLRPETKSVFDRVLD